MATYAPTELLHLWKTEQLLPETATGHLVQHLVKQHNELESQRRAIASLRADIDRLLAHTRLPPNIHGKPKSTKPDETPDPKQPS